MSISVLPPLKATILKIDNALSSDNALNTSGIGGDQANCFV